MSRYFDDSADIGVTKSLKQPEVFNISKKDTDSVVREKRKRRKKDLKKGGGDPAKVLLARKRKKGQDKFPGKAPIDPDALEHHNRGDGVIPRRLKTKYAITLAERKEKSRKLAHETAARAEILLQDVAGYLEPDSDDEFTGRVTQTQIRQAVDVDSAAKGFELNLPQFGPYQVDYTRNGRHLVLGGRKGHVAALDWVDKKLKCEINVQESVHDVKWLHTENMFAVAQKKWTYIYDNQGIELHCLKQVDNVIRMEFLPYHFLLATASEYGFLSWLDVSVGKMVAQFNAKRGRLPIMCVNPANAVACLGHSKGTVTMWTPNDRDPVVKMWAHKQPLTAIAVDRSGTYMATSAMDRSVKIWDARMFKCLKDYKLHGAPSHIQFSDRKVLGVSIDNEVQLFRDACTQDVEYPYLRHRVWKYITDMHFVPYEDVMGIGHSAGFTSILVPGCGEPNYDALEANPYQTKKQRREAEVKALLDKIPSDLISLNPRALAEVNLSKLKQNLEQKESTLHVKPQRVEFDPRNKSRGRSGTAKRYHIKRTVEEEELWKQLKEKSRKDEQSEKRLGKKKKEKKPKGLLERL